MKALLLLLVTIANLLPALSAQCGSCATTTTGGGPPSLFFLVAFTPGTETAGMCKINPASPPVPLCIPDGMMPCKFSWSLDITFLPQPQVTQAVPPLGFGGQLTFTRPGEGDQVVDVPLVGWPQNPPGPGEPPPNPSWTITALEAPLPCSSSATMEVRVIPPGAPPGLPAGVLVAQVNNICHQC